MLDQFKKELITLIQEGKLPLCLERLREAIIFDLDNEVFKDITLLSGQHSEQKRKRLRGANTAENDVAMNNIQSAVLDLISKIGENDLDKNLSRKYKIFPRILLVAKNSDTLNEVRRAAFPGSVFEDLEPYGVDDFPISLRSDDTQLVVFANPKHTNDSVYQSKIKQYLDQPDKPMIFYYGERLPWLDEYPEQVYAANSVFSVQARIREMLEYFNSRKTIGQERIG